MKCEICLTSNAEFELGINDEVLSVCLKCSEDKLESGETMSDDEILYSCEIRQSNVKDLPESEIEKLVDELSDSVMAVCQRFGLNF
jgi:hypothetical protein